MKTCAVVLAAGQSVRMGTQKLLLPFRHQTLIGHVVDQVLAGPVAGVFVVVGADEAGIRQALTGRPVTMVKNPDPAGDMLSSVRCGLRALPDDCQAVAVVLGDQPGITPELLRRLVRAFEAGPRSIVLPVYGGRGGHPLVFAARYRDEVLTRFDGIGLRGLLQAHPDQVQPVEVESASVLDDIDRPADYQRALRR